MATHRFYVLARFSLLALFCAATVGLLPAQDKPKDEDTAKKKGEVWVGVLPEEAYIWVDGNPVSHRSSDLKLSAGEHSITVYNYGFEPQTRKVNVAGGDFQQFTVELKPLPGRVNGPWGRIQIEGVPGDSMVFMNGTTPEFFVGHADEMNNNFLTVQTLLAPVGTHQLHIVRPKTNQPVWSGAVEVKEDKRAILYVKGQDKAHVVYKDWSHGKNAKDLKRFEAGTASAKIAVARVTGKFTADKQDVKCNEPVKLAWTSSEAPLTTITANNQKVADGPRGEVDVKPKETTKYVFRAAGPGGSVTQEANVTVDPKVNASLSASTQDLQYVKVGDKVQQQGSAELQWSATNADSVTLDPIGPMSGDRGTQTVQASPGQTNPGPLDETQTFKLTATNVCGGSDTKTVALHVTGSIEPEQVAQAEPPPEPTPAPALPATASPMPLLALLGLISLGGGVLLRSAKR
jgi:PEGA domain